jgi:RNA polymerase sigma-70 factor (ECF subfamily)
VKTDAELIRAAVRDHDAFAELYRRHAQSVNSWLRARSGDRIASELTAETFAQAALSLRRFRDEAGGSALPWLLGIARNLLRRSFERERVEAGARRRLGMPLRSYEVDMSALDDRADAERLAPTLASALARLPRTQRDALELRVVRDLAYDEVAAQLGCTAVAARIRVMRALASLSRLLKGATP